MFPSSEVLLPSSSLSSFHKIMMISSFPPYFGKVGGVFKETQPHAFALFNSGFCLLSSAETPELFFTPMVNCFFSCHCKFHSSFHSWLLFSWFNPLSLLHLPDRLLFSASPPCITLTSYCLSGAVGTTETWMLSVSELNLLTSRAVTLLLFHSGSPCVQREGRPDDLWRNLYPKTSMSLELFLFLLFLMQLSF